VLASAISLRERSISLLAYLRGLVSSIHIHHHHRL
jgi:hypothetical protein